MVYFKVAVGKFIEFDEATSRAQVFLRSDLVDQKRDLQARIGVADPGMPSTNAAWIAWAKANYPYVDHSAEQAELDRVNAVLDAIKDL